MDSIWKLLETCIIPIITYGADTWNLNKQETKELDKILDQIIKRIFKNTRNYTKGGSVHRNWPCRHKHYNEAKATESTAEQNGKLTNKNHH